MIKIFGLAAVLAAAYGVEGGYEAAAIMLCFMASLFYLMAFKLFAGLSQAMVTGNVDILYMITAYMTYFTMAVVTFYGPYSYVALIALPWLTIQALINMLAVLIKLDIVGINPK